MNARNSTVPWALFSIVFVVASANGADRAGPVQSASRFASVEQSAPEISGGDRKPPASSVGSGAETLEVRNYGAKCNGDPSGDDSAAINAAIDAARTRLAASTYGSVILSFPAGSMPCVVKSTLNFTGFQQYNRRLIIEGHSAAIYGRVQNAPIVDALGSHHLVWNDLAIIGSGDEPVPSYGLVIGAVDDGNGGAINTFNNLNIAGYFSKAGLYNMGGEANTFIAPSIVNHYAKGEVYAAVFDGFNHFGASSQFARQTLAADTPHSFNTNVVINGRFAVDFAPEGIPVWIGGSRNHTWLSSYAYNKLGRSCVKLSQLNAWTGLNTSLRLDLHCENNGLKNVFEITGPYPNPSLNGFAYTDGIVFANEFIFKLSDKIKTVSLRDADIHITAVSPPAAKNLKMFDSPAKWAAVTGDFFLDAGSVWNEPAHFDGRRLLGDHSEVAAGEVHITTGGAGLKIKEGEGATMGTCTLAAGNCSAVTDKVTTSSRIFLSIQELGSAVKTPSTLAVKSRTPGSGFGVVASQPGDNSVVAWLIVNPE